MVKSAHLKTVKGRMPWNGSPGDESAVRNYHEFCEARKTALKIAQLPTYNQFVIWAEIWRDFFEQDFYSSPMAIPERKTGFDWSVVVPNLSISQILGAIALRGLFKVKTDHVKLENLDNFWEAWEENPRPAHKPYLVWVRPRLESDYEFEGKSVYDLARLRVNGITLGARVMLQILMQTVTRGVAILDRNSWTLCSSSTDKNGIKPAVYWNSADEFLQIAAWYPNFRSGLVRTREVVT